MEFTYSSLVSSLQSWPQHASSEYVAAIPTMIGLAETRLARDLNLELFDVTSSAPVTSIGSRSVSKPADLIQTRSLHLIVGDTRPALERRSYEWCLDYAPDVSEQGTPEYYAELDSGAWYLVPTPDAVLNIVARYVARPTGLSSGNQTTWLSTNVGDALFAACLMESEHFLKADDRYEDMKRKYYEELLPTARLELRQSVRDGDYAPVKPAAQTVE